MLALVPPVAGPGAAFNGASEQVVVTVGQEDQTLTVPTSAVQPVGSRRVERDDREPDAGGRAGRAGYGPRLVAVPFAFGDVGERCREPLDVLEI
jgi:hypothetical protein